MRGSLPARHALTEICLLQGEFRVSGDRTVALTTLLGSCVATCLYDPFASVGGMNHFLLATGPAVGVRSERYGIHAMEELINGLLKMGASHRRLRAKLFGAATLEEAMAQIGRENASFALSYLERENIPLVASSLGGHRGRRVFFIPTTGTARQRFIDDPPSLKPAPPPPLSDIMFFEDDP